MQAHWETHLLTLAGDMPRPSTAPRSSYPADHATLRQAYAICDQVTASHSRSFYAASALLRGDQRSAVRALYAFCRTVDDIVDEGPAAGSHERLAYWRRVVQAASIPGGDPVAAAWFDTLNRYDIPRHYALQLIDGVARDLTQKRYRTFPDLATYCYGVASTVGLMSMYIIGFKSRDALPYAIKLGVALQLTNILRDVREDLRGGRVYLPQDDLMRFGLSIEDLAGARVTPAWRAFMRFQLERAREMYAQAEPGIRLLERDGRLAIAAASAFYQGILDDIEAHDYDVFTRRARLGVTGKLRRLSLAWARLSLV